MFGQAMRVLIMVRTWSSWWLWIKSLVASAKNHGKSMFIPPTVGCTNYITHRIHVWYIYANIGGILMVNVTIYSNTWILWVIIYYNLSIRLWHFLTNVQMPIYMGPYPRYRVISPCNNDDRMIGTEKPHTYPPSICTRRIDQSHKWYSLAILVYMILSSWWFGTFFLFFHILGIIIPTDFHIFQRGRYTTNQWWCIMDHG